MFGGQGDGSGAARLGGLDPLGGIQVARVEHRRALGPRTPLTPGEGVRAEVDEHHGS